MSRLAAVAAGGAWLTLPAGFLAAPGLWALWCLFGGVAQASSFTVIFIMLAGMPGDERRTAARSGLIQSAGYGVAAVAPVVLGGLHEATGSWTLPLVVLEAACAVFGVTASAAAARVSARRPADAASGAVEQLSARQMREPSQAIAMYLAALAELLDSPPGKIRTSF